MTFIKKLIDKYVDIFKIEPKYSINNLYYGDISLLHKRVKTHIAYDCFKSPHQDFAILYKLKSCTGAPQYLHIATNTIMSDTMHADNGDYVVGNIKPIKMLFPGLDVSNIKLLFTRLSKSDIINLENYYNSTCKQKKINIIFQ